MIAKPKESKDSEAEACRGSFSVRSGGPPFRRVRVLLWIRLVIFVLTSMMKHAPFSKQTVSRGPLLRHDQKIQIGSRKKSKRGPTTLLGKINDLDTPPGHGWSVTTHHSSTMIDGYHSSPLLALRSGRVAGFPSTTVSIFPNMIRVIGVQWEMDGEMDTNISNHNLIQTC